MPASRIEPETFQTKKDAHHLFLIYCDLFPCFRFCLCYCQNLVKSSLFLALMEPKLTQIEIILRFLVIQFHILGEKRVIFAL